MKERLIQKLKQVGKNIKDKVTDPKWLREELLKLFWYFWGAFLGIILGMFLGYKKRDDEFMNTVWESDKYTLTATRDKDGYIGFKLRPKNKD